MASTVQIIIEGIQAAGTLGLLSATSAGIDDIKESAGSAVDTLKSYAAAVTAVGVAYVGVTSVQGGITAIINATAALEQQQTALAGIATGAAQASQAWTFASTLAGDTKTLAEAFVLLQSAGLEPATGSLQALNTASIALSGSQEQLIPLVQQLSSAYKQGSLSIAEIDKLIADGIPAWQLLAEATGQTTAEVMALAQAGQLGRSAITGLITALGGAGAQTANAQLNTYTGLLARLTRQAQDFFVAVGQAGVIDAAKAQLQSFLAVIDQLRESGRWEAITQALSAALSEIVAAAGELLRTLLEAVIQFAQSGQLKSWAAETSIALRGMSDAVRFASGWVETLYKAFLAFEAGSFILRFALIGTEVYLAGNAVFYLIRALRLVDWSVVISGTISAVRAFYAFALQVPIAGAALQYFAEVVITKATVFALLAGGATIAAAALYILWQRTQTEVDALNRLTAQQSKVANFNEEFVKMRKELNALGEEKASQNLMEFFTLDANQFKNNLQAAQQYFSDIKTLSQQRIDTERRISDLQKQIQKDTVQSSINAKKQELESIKASLNESLQAEKQYAQEIRRVRQELVDATISGESTVREIRRRNLSEEQQQADIESEIGSLNIDNAMALLRLRQSAAGENAKLLVQEIKERADRQLSLAREITNTEAAAVAASSASDQKKTAYREEIRILEEAANAQQENTEKLKQQVIDTQAQIELLSQSLADLEKGVTIPVDVQIQQAREDLREIELKLEILRKGIDIPVRIQEARTGESSGFATGGLIPGYGGGDRQMILAEQGEFVIRKEAVRKWGMGLFAALNEFRLPASFSSIPRFASGGPVTGGDTVNLNITLGGSQFKLFGARDQVKGFSEAMTRLARGLA